MSKRVVTGFLMAIAAVLLLLFSPFWLLMTVLSVIGALCFLEYTRMMGFVRTEPLVGITLLALLLSWAMCIARLWDGAIGVLLLAVIVVWLVQFRRADAMQSAISQLAIVLFGAVYVMLLWIPMAELVRLPSRGFLFLLLATTHGGDAVAYLIGKRWGRHLLAPRLSPNKTWEGWIAGLGGAVVAGLVCDLIFSLPFTVVEIIIVGLLLGIAASLGDLAESMLKRSQGVKDSGTWIPGHGGILDRVDGLFFSAPVLYFILAVILKKF